MEIERKYLIEEKNLPRPLEQYECLFIEQAYLCTDPVIRIRQENDSYYLTYKGRGLMVRGRVQPSPYARFLSASAFQGRRKQNHEKKISDPPSQNQPHH